MGWQWAKVTIQSSDSSLPKTHAGTFLHTSTHAPPILVHKFEMRKTATKKGKGSSVSAVSAPLPLVDVICCVETFNSDGIDSSSSHIQTLKVGDLSSHHDNL
jgi:hypothetical protein